MSAATAFLCMKGRCLNHGSEDIRLLVSVWLAVAVVFHVISCSNSIRLGCTELRFLLVAMELNVCSTAGRSHQRSVWSGVPSYAHLSPPIVQDAFSSWACLTLSSEMNAFFRGDSLLAAHQKSISRYRVARSGKGRPSQKLIGKPDHSAQLSTLYWWCCSCPKVVCCSPGIFPSHQIQLKASPVSSGTGFLEAGTWCVITFAMPGRYISPKASTSFPFQTYPEIAHSSLGVLPSIQALSDPLEGRAQIMSQNAALYSSVPGLPLPLSIFCSRISMH